jgi:parallel beta helix pectate lyase-like protein
VSGVTIGGDIGGTDVSPRVTSTHLAAPLPPGQGGVAAVSPMTYGAVFNGSTDDSADISTAIAAGGVIEFPPGTTVAAANQLKFTSSNLHIRGAGMYATTVKCTSGALSSLWVYGPSFVSAVELSDMTLDGTGVSVSAIATLGNRLDRLRVRRVRFVNWPSVIIQSGYAADTIIEDCEADGAGTGQGTFFLSTNRENESIIIRRNRLRWLNTGITIAAGNPATTQYHSAYVDICGNYIDLGWWLLKAASSGSGGTVSYTSNTVTDSSAPFTAGSVAAGTTVRVLTPLVTGTLTTIGTQVTDASASFTTASVWRGHIVRCGSAFAVVSKVESATQLHVEEWLSQATYQPVTPPTSASYTIYGVVLGAALAGNTTTTITIAHGGGGNGGNWYDLHGNEVTPSAGTLYEVLPAHPVYPVFCNIPAEKVKICGNTIRRGWADGIEFFGSRGIITGNIVEDGQDEGIVCEGLSAASPGIRNVVANNICRHNGTSGLNLQYQADLEVGPNQLEDNCWGDPSSLNLPQLEAFNLVNSTITGGRASSGGETAVYNAGMTIDGASTSGLKVIGWSGHGAAVADIRITSAVPAGACDLLDVDGVIAYQGTANGQRLRVKGTGSPSLPASPGSVFLSVSGAGGGTTLYVKESGSGASGWDAMGAATPYGQRAAYSAITSSVTATAASNSLTSMTAFTGTAPSITLPDDGHAYRVTLSAGDMGITPQQEVAVGVGTSATAIIKFCFSGVASGEQAAPCIIITDVTGSGQTITCYAYSSLGTGTVTLGASAGSPAELSAVLVA